MGSRLTMDDHLLRTMLSEGNPEAFRALYNHYHQRVYRYALKILGENEAAKDVMQDTFLKAHGRWKYLAKAESIIGWLLAIARNEVFQLIRKKRRNGDPTLQAGELQDPETPYEMLVGKEVTCVVRSALMQLKVEYREVLVLREYEQLSYAEIAALTGDTQSSVKSRIFKARRTLMEKLRPFFGERP